MTIIAAIVILQHEPNDGPCFFAEYLIARRRPFVVFRMWDEASAAAAPSTVEQTFIVGGTDPAGYFSPHTVQEGLCSVAGVAVLGGYMSANDALPYYEKVFSLLSSAVAQRVPVIGHCLGAQLLSKALGGSVTASRERELGWVRQEVLPIAEADPRAKDWFRGRRSITVFHWHSESFSIPEGAFLVAAGEHCTNQAFQVGDAFVIGMQFHCEIDRPKALHYFHEDLSTVLSAADAAATGDKVACRMTREALEASLAADDSSELVESRRLATDIYDTWCGGIPSTS